MLLVSPKILEECNAVLLYRVKRRLKELLLLLPKLLGERKIVKLAINKL